MTQAARFEISSSAAQVAPGGSLQLQLTITNTSSIVDRFTIAVSGVPADWYTLDRSAVSLFPGVSADLVLTLHPPADPPPMAGAHPFTLTATSEDDGSQSATCDVALSVSGRGDLWLDVAPTSARGRRAIFQLTFHNDTNAAASLSLLSRAAEDVLQVRQNLDGPFTLAPGRQTTVQVRMRPARRRLIGEPHSYEIEFRGVREGTDELSVAEPRLTRQARFTYEPLLQGVTLPSRLRRLPRRMLALLLLLGVALLALLSLYAGHAVVATGHPYQAPTHVPSTATASPIHVLATAVIPSATLIPSSQTSTPEPTGVPTGTPRPTPRAAVTLSSTASPQPTSTVRPMSTPRATPAVRTTGTPRSTEQPTRVSTQTVVVPTRSPTITVHIQGSATPPPPATTTPARLTATPTPSRPTPPRATATSAPVFVKRTATASATRAALTLTPIPTATGATRAAPTLTPVPTAASAPSSTASATPKTTRARATATATPSATKLSPTFTPRSTITATPAPFTATGTATPSLRTPVPPTTTGTATLPIPTPSGTATLRPSAPTAAPSPTKAPATSPLTATATASATRVPSTSTATASATPVPPSATATFTSTLTPIPPTNTHTATRTPVPPTRTFTPTFSPTPSATSTATRTSTATVTATATPLPPPQVSLSPTFLGGLPGTVTVMNTGTGADLIITGVTFSGTSAANFTVLSNTCGSGVHAGGSCTVEVGFVDNGAPTCDSGDSCGTMTISDNAPEGQQQVTLDVAGIIF